MKVVAAIAGELTTWSDGGDVVRGPLLHARPWQAEAEQEPGGRTTAMHGGPHRR
jgi:hypothetical protein